MNLNGEEEKERLLNQAQEQEEERNPNRITLDSIDIEGRGNAPGGSRLEASSLSQRSRDDVEEALEQANRLRILCSTFQYSIQTIFIILIMTKILIVLRLFVFDSTESTCHLPTFFFLAFGLFLDFFMLTTNTFIVYKLFKRQFIEVNRVIMVRFILQG